MTPTYDSHVEGWTLFAWKVLQLAGDVETKRVWRAEWLRRKAKLVLGRPNRRWSQELQHGPPRLWCDACQCDPRKCANGLRLTSTMHRVLLWPDGRMQLVELDAETFDIVERRHA